MVSIARVKGKAFMMFELKKENKVIAFIKRNPELVISLAWLGLGFVIPDAYAAGDLGNLERELTTKIGQVAKVMRLAAGALGGISVVIFVVSCFRGEPNYRIAGFTMIGAAVLAVAQKITTWLSVTM